MPLHFVSNMVTSALASGKQQGNKSVSSESSSNLTESSCRKRKANIVTELDKKLCKENRNNVNNYNVDEFERKYKQLGLIGRGGFGSVYAGLRLADSLPVAIKYANSRRVQRELKAGCVPLEVVLMQRSGGGPESVGKFATVTLLDWYCMDQKLVLVMERPQTSLDLAAYVHFRGGRLQEDEARVLMNQLVDASMEIHSKGVFHRDLKLENALVEIGCPVPRLRIIDFGCGSYEQKTFSRFFCGTLPYAPPEWFRYEKYKPVPTTVWQLGVMLYCMLHKFSFDTRSFTHGCIKFSSNLSQECLEFLHLCLEVKSRKRATLEQLRAHAWLN
ncbi:serine/threonine-protein kinase pim-1-like [Fundulus diaphanus]